MILTLEDDSIDAREVIGFPGSAKSTFASTAYVLYAALVIGRQVSDFDANYATESQTAAAKFAEAQAQMSAASVRLGAALLPLIETVMPKLVAAVTAAVTWFTKPARSRTERHTRLFGILGALGPVLLVLGSLFSVVGTLITAFSTVAPFIAAAGAAMGPVAYKLDHPTPSDPHFDRWRDHHAVEHQRLSANRLPHHHRGNLDDPGLDCSKGVLLGHGAAVSDQSVSY